MRKLGIALIVIVMGLVGCAGHQTFNHLARSNDTVAVAAGWMQTFSRDWLKVTITDINGTETIYDVGDPNIRAVINMYPDPVSNIVVSREAAYNTSPGAATYAEQVNYNYTGYDNDWWQTMVLVNLPDNMALGEATILIESIDPVTSMTIETASSVVEVVDGGGAPHPFTAYYPWGVPFGLSSDQVMTLERASHYQIDFSGGGEIPAAISVELTHDPGIDNGGVGRVVVVNPTAVQKNIHWVDDGVKTKVIILPTTSAGFTRMVDFKFYVSGGVENLFVSDVRAFRQNGEEIFTVSANATAR